MGSVFTALTTPLHKKTKLKALHRPFRAINSMILQLTAIFWFLYQTSCCFLTCWTKTALKFGNPAVFQLIGFTTHLWWLHFRLFTFLDFCWKGVFLPPGIFAELVFLSDSVETPYRRRVSAWCLLWQCAYCQCTKKCPTLLAWLLFSKPIINVHFLKCDCWTVVKLFLILLLPAEL